jgi:hypothetical protein
LAKTKVDPFKRKHEPLIKSTSIGRGMVKTSSMNKSKKASYKKYRGQGK